MSNEQDKDINLTYNKNDDVFEHKDDEKHYTINEIAEETGLTAANIRKIQNDIEIIVPRDALNRRYYTEVELNIFRQIKVWKDNRWSTAQIISALSASSALENQQTEAMARVSIEKLTGNQLMELFTRPQFAELLFESEAFKTVLSNLFERTEQVISDKILTQQSAILKESAEAQESVLQDHMSKLLENQVKSLQENMELIISNQKQLLEEAALQQEKLIAKNSAVYEPTLAVFERKVDDIPVYEPRGIFKWFFKKKERTGGRAGEQTVKILTEEQTVRVQENNNTSD